MISILGYFLYLLNLFYEFESPLIFKIDNEYLSKFRIYHIWNIGILFIHISFFIILNIFILIIIHYII